MSMASVLIKMGFITDRGLDSLLLLKDEAKRRLSFNLGLTSMQYESEDEKEKYFTKGNIRYFKTNNINNNDFSLNNVMIPLKNCDFNNNIYINNNNKIYLEKNNCISDLNVNSTYDRKSSKFFAQKKFIRN